MPTQVSDNESKPTHAEIAERARAIFEKSGRIPGRDEQNWLQAESELIAARKREAGPREAAPRSSTGSKSTSKPTQRQDSGQAHSYAHRS